MKKKIIGMVIFTMVFFISCGVDGGSPSTTTSPPSTPFLYTWGLNDEGQLGDGGNSVVSRPGKIGESKWASISMGGTHSVGINDAGELYAWGLNEAGQLGNGVTGSEEKSVVPTIIGENNWFFVDAGVKSTGALHK